MPSRAQHLPPWFRDQNVYAADLIGISLGKRVGQSGRRIKCVYIIYLNLKFLLQMLRIIKTYFEDSKFKSTSYNFEEVISTF